MFVLVLFRSMLFSFVNDSSTNLICFSDTIRWNFIQSEVPVHRKRMMVDKKCWSRNFRRAIQKKVLQNKQQIKDLETAKKNFQLTTQVQIPVYYRVVLNCRLHVEVT